MFAHLVSNRLVPSPEIPSDVIAKMVEVCLVAVAVAREGLLDEIIRLPERVTLRGENIVQVHELIEAFDLEDWLY